MPECNAAPAAPPRSTDWRAIASSQEFRALTHAKARFIVPASIFFIIYYFALPVLVGYFPAFMERRVLGAINLAYLFALSEFLMAWAIMWLYIRAARRWDAMEHEILRHLESNKRGIETRGEMKDS